jgi:tRNA nucleotidyltransferase/poly(A) polymerase
MAQNPHYKELLQLLNEFDVEYLIVGGFAVMKYGEPRYTKDLDVWVNNSPENSARVVAVLRQFGAPVEHDQITADTFTNKQVVYQIGVAPIRIDILTELTGVAFRQAWESKVSSTFFGVPVNFIRSMT